MLSVFSRLNEPCKALIPDVVLLVFRDAAVISVRPVMVV